MVIVRGADVVSVNSFARGKIGSRFSHDDVAIFADQNVLDDCGDLPGSNREELTDLNNDPS